MAETQYILVIYVSGTRANFCALLWLKGVKAKHFTTVYAT